MLIAEELLLLSLDNKTGRAAVGTEKLDPALGAAVLVELALAERITVAGDAEGRRQRGRVSVTFTTPTDHPVLDDALTYVQAHEGKKMASLIRPMAWQPMFKGLRPLLLNRLAAAGVLSEQQGRALGIFPLTTWPTVDDTPENAIRARIRSALVDGTTPTERTVALIALLHATGQVARTLPDQDKKTVQRRAKELAQGDWAASAVKQAIDAATAVIVTAATAGGGDGGS